MYILDYDFIILILTVTIVIFLSVYNSHIMIIQFMFQVTSFNILFRLKKYYQNGIIEIRIEIKIIIIIIIFFILIMTRKSVNKNIHAILWIS